MSCITVARLSCKIVVQRKIRVLNPHFWYPGKSMFQKELAKSRYNAIRTLSKGE